MSNTQLRANVRNLLVGATLQEAWDYRVGQLARGHAESVGYADEYVREVRDEFDDLFSRFDFVGLSKPDCWAICIDLANCVDSAELGNPGRAESIEKAADAAYSYYLELHVRTDCGAFPS
jgi:hypothetical protein